MKILKALTAGTLSLALVACGSSGDSSSADTGTVTTADPAIAGETQSSGVFTEVFVPEGWSILEIDDTYIEVIDADDNGIVLSYMDNTDEDSIAYLLDYSKKVYTEDQKEVEVTYNGVTWSGISYTTYDATGFDVYTKLSESAYMNATTDYYTVGAGEYPIDSAETKAILSSIVIASES